MMPDDVMDRFKNKNIQFKIWTENEEEEKMVFIEGSQDSLLYLSELFRVMAKESETDCGFQITLGQKILKEGSTHGIYIHRLPCLEHEK